MLNTKLIPTPLRTREPRVAEVPKPIRSRSYFVFVLMLRALWSLAMMRWGRPSDRHTPLGLARLITAGFERLGGLWIKAAQILAIRRDMFSKEFCDEMSRLQDRAEGFPGELARQIIEEDLGKSVDELFKDFKLDPIAAASIGQVHVAVLRDVDRKVAIKVQRPNIHEVVRRDLAILNSYVLLLQFFRIKPGMQWEDMYLTLQRTVTDELDYRLEASSMKRMRQTLKTIKVVCPRPFQQYCSKRVLTMEFIDGVLVSDFIQEFMNEPKKAKKWCKENKIDIRKFGRRLYFSMAKQIFIDNLLHGDLHPGNIMMLKKSRIAFIDFGSVSQLEPEFLKKFDMCVRYLARRNFSKFAEIFFTLIPGIPMTVNIEAAQEEVIRMAENWESFSCIKGIPYEQRAVTTFIAQIISVLAINHKFPIDWSTLSVLRTMTALDATFRFVHPNLDFFKEMKTFHARRQFIGIARLASRQARNEITTALNDAKKLPELIGENAYFQAELFRKRAMSFQATISKSARIGKSILGVVLNVGLIATLFALARYVTKHHGIGESAVSKLPVRDIFGTMPHLAPGMWVALIFLLLYLLRSIKNFVGVLGVEKSGANPFLRGDN